MTGKTFIGRRIFVVSILGAGTAIATLLPDVGHTQTDRVKVSMAALKAKAAKLALQLHSVFQVRALCGGLMGPPPERPSNDMGRLDAPLRKPRGDAADFLRRPVDKGWLCFRTIIGGGFGGGWRFA